MLIVRQRSVAWAVELLSVGENRARCVAAGFVPILAGMLREKDYFIRENLALCFKHLAEGKISVASQNKTLRKNAFEALEALAQMSHLVRFELVKEGTVLKFLLMVINDETDQWIRQTGLEVLSKCISGGNYNVQALEELLAVNSVPTAIRFIQSPWRNLQESACRFLCLLCITIDIQGKKDFVMIKGIPIILKLLDLTDEQLCLFDIAVNTHFLLPQHHIFEKLLLLNVAEYPVARKELFQDGLVALREIIKTSTSPLMKKRAKQGLQQLHFDHLPHQFPYDKMDKIYLRGTPKPTRSLQDSYPPTQSPSPPSKSPSYSTKPSTSSSPVSILKRPTSPGKRQ
ncbi:hypothetical protein AXG93_2167s1320 [Marchantia polymorpha subsp. ruderalis]|uniref:TOG domain-containing protein n=1 Tax=Marchantia polymorpha subsp. ruderalis TaxID=1480154 RepID=A0A176W5B8_MARPO|nr:hypothetical protein AXG93_2167s1320 [Marchantia polymorpha subsp. ruderalis]